LDLETDNEIRRNAHGDVGTVCTIVPKPTDRRIRLLNDDTAKDITKKARTKYRKIIADLPEFEKADRFKMNLVNCAMIGAFILSMPQRPEVDRLTDYYAKAMMTAPMQWFCRKSGKSKFTAKDIAAMKATAALKAADRNPYSWNMEFYEYPDGSGYEGRFTKVRHLCADEGAGTVRPDPRPVPSGLHHERSGRRDKFRAAVHPCLRRTLLRLRIQADTKRRKNK